MNIIKMISLLGFIFINIITAQAQQNSNGVNLNPNAKPDSSKKSIKAAAVGKIGHANVTINYHSPGVRNRIIWGGLVPYNDVWVTGAHSATTFEIDKSFILGNKKISEGKYALFTIPGESEWTIILNKNWEQHLADDYDAKDDIVRFAVKPSAKPNVTERLQYFIEDDGNNKGTVIIEWEKLSVRFDIKVL